MKALLGLSLKVLGVLVAALILFFAAHGALTICCTDAQVKLRPESSGDVAAWVQAIGAVLAILASYHLGARQVAEAQKEADKRYRQDRTSRENGYFSIMEALHVATCAVEDSFEDRGSWDSFLEEWNSYLGPNLTAALAAFDAMPAHDLGTTTRINSAFLLRTSAQMMLGGVNSSAQNSIEAVAEVSAELVISESAAAADDGWQAICHYFPDQSGE